MTPSSKAPTHCLRQVAVSLLLASSFKGAVGAQARARLDALPAPQIKSLVMSLQQQKIVAAPVDIDQEQVYALHAPHADTLVVVPVRLWPDVAPQHFSSCGVVFQKVGGDRQYVPLLAPSATHADICEGVNAVGLMPDPGPRPRLLVLFDATAGHGPDYTVPYVLRWNAGKSVYEQDVTASAWLLQQRGRGTLASIRRLLRGFKS